MLIEIKSDALDIVKRIKKIDKNYKLFYNTKKDAFELHNQKQLFSSFCLSFPYKFIDERMVDYTLKTRSQNKDKIFKEIEEQNKKLIEEEVKRCKEKILQGDGK